MIHLLHLHNYPIFEQLRLEEALLRADMRNWCIINEGSTPAIVMGISGKPHELVDQRQQSINKVPIIKRFSGGGTVVVDEDTLFVTFIFQKDSHDFPCYPEPIHNWAGDLYQSIFNMRLRENDYVIGEKKCGGNAQYIKKDRWLHHTSFLWNFKSELMEYLLHPKKTPSYREGRPHHEFLCQLSDHFPSKEAFISELKANLAMRYPVKEMNLEEASEALAEPHRQTTAFIFPD